MLELFLLGRGFPGSASTVILLRKPHRKVAAFGQLNEALTPTCSPQGPLPLILPFPTTLGSCFAVLLASVGKHHWPCLYSGVQSSFSVYSGEQGKD